MWLSLHRGTRKASGMRGVVDDRMGEGLQDTMQTMLLIVATDTEVAPGIRGSRAMLTKNGCLQKKVGYNAVVSASGGYWGFTWGVSRSSWGCTLEAENTTGCSQSLILGLPG